MPMLDAYLPEGAFGPEAEHALLGRLTDILLKNEGVDPTNEAARSIAWVFLHRPASIHVSGAPTPDPHYKFVASVPEGQFNRERRKSMISAITEAVLDAEAGARPRQPERVWVFTPEVPEGTWGGMGRVFGLAQIAGYVLGNEAAGQLYADRIFEERVKGS